MIGFGKRVSYAFRCFFSVISSGEVPEDIAPEVNPAAKAASAARPGPPLPPPPPLPVLPAATDSTDRAVQMLALLQRDGRLVDFFNEDIAPYKDAQIGAAVRELHANCRKVLEQYVKLEPVIASEEDQPVTIDDGFDPAAIKLVGNVTGRPPLRGLLRHRGWRVSAVELPPLSPDQTGRHIIAPAEVEIP